MSNWNVLSVEAALQQLNSFEEDNKEIIKRPNTVNYRDSNYSSCNLVDGSPVIISPSSFEDENKAAVT